MTLPDFCQTPNLGTSMKKQLTIVLALTTVALTDCSGCSPAVGAEKSGSIAGFVLKGPVSGATITAFSVDEKGRRDDELGTAETDDLGAFVVDVAGHAGPTLVCSSQGVYTEESTGGLVQAGPVELCRLIEDFELGAKLEGAILTPWTSLHAELTACFVDLGREASVTGGSQRAALRLNDFLAAGVDGYDFATTIPADVTSATGLSLSAEAWAGILTAGLSESATAISEANGVAPGVRFTAMTLTDTLRQDVAGGCIFDGSGVGGAALAQGGVAVSADTLRGAPNGLAQSIGAFLRGPRNTSGINEASVADLTRALSSHTSEIFGGGGIGDLDPPIVSIIEPVSGPVSGSPSIRVEATDASAIETLAFTAPAFLVDEGTLTCETPTSCVLVATLNTSLIEGASVTITVEAVDVAGNRGSDDVTVVVNNTAPVINIQSPTPDETVEGIVDVIATVTDPDGLESFTVDIPGVTVTANCAPPVLVTNCDSDPDPLKIDIRWDTTQSNEGEATINFVATDTASQSGFASVDVVVDNLAAGVINGRVDLGSPVTGATVSIVAVEANGSRGALVGVDTQLGTDGSYQIEDPTSRTGPMLVVVTGGTFVDVATGVGLNVNAGQELLAAVEAGAPGGVLTANVNAWTTLAARRALTHVAEEDDVADAIRTNRRLFELYFRRPSPDLPLPILTTTSAALADDVPDSESSDGALIALTHAGLSRLAADTSVLTGQSVGAITIVDVINVLGLDVSDVAGQFNGRAGDAELFLDPARAVPLDSITPRARLAVAVFAFATNAELGNVIQPRNKSGITGASLAQPNRILDDIALYDEPRLFPESEPPQPFDRDPPVIEFSFLAPHETAELGDELSGLVNLFGSAIDVSELTRFEIVAPDTLVGVDLIGGDIDSLQVAIGTRESPNIEDVALTCGLVAGDPPLDFTQLDRQVCVCAEATDIAANTGAAVGCFARAAVTGTMQPASPATLPIDMAPLVFSSTSGLDLTACRAHVVVNNGLAGEVDFVGVASQQSCTITMPIAFDSPGLDLTLQGASPLSPIDIDISVDEVSGTSRQFSFGYTLDARPPTAQVTSPPTNGLTLRTPPSIRATVADEGTGVASVTAVVRTGVVVHATLTGTVGAGGAVTFPDFVDAAADGERVIEVTVVDGAGNPTTVQRGYLKDTTPPTLAGINPTVDGNPLLYFVLNQSTSTFSPSTGCNTFPFDNCIFDLAAGATKRQVLFTQDAASAETYERWQNFTSLAINPSTFASPPAENRAPTLRLKTEANISVQARFDASCATDANFDLNSAGGARTLGSFIADAQGLVDIPFTDSSGLPGSSGPFLREQVGAATLCLTIRARDAAGNVGSVVSHFFKFISTPPPIHLRWNDAAFDPADLADDVGAFDNANDDEVLGGTGQGTGGRVFAHAYIVTPSAFLSQNYTFSLSAGSSPTMDVIHQPTVQVSPTSAFNWCFTIDGADADSVVDGDDDDFESPDLFSIANTVNTPTDAPSWSHTESQSANPSWTLYAINANVNSPTSRMEHQPLRAGETDATGTLNPAASYSTGADTIQTAAQSTFTATVGAVTLEVYRFNRSSGTPQGLIDAGTSVGFSLGGSSLNNRNAMILLRGTVPNSGVTLKDAQTINGQPGTVGFNDACRARNAAGTTVNQAPTVIPNRRWVVVDQAIPGNVVEPVAPKPFLWVEDGGFHFCNGSTADDCRYGRIFDNFIRAEFKMPAGRAFVRTGSIEVSGAPIVNLSNTSIPSGVTRTLSQEP